ncbi:MAG: hypothetical protein ACTSUR_00575 [Candidatus Heimdallarchaeaceae archaeon]
MKEKIVLTFSFYVPLLEIIYEDTVRPLLNFLKTSEGLCSKLERIYFERKGHSLVMNKEKKKNPIFVPKIGDIKIKLRSDSYTYYKSTRDRICEKEPIRPLISFSTDFIKWRINESSFKVLNPRKKAEIFLFLVACITKKVSLESKTATIPFKEKLKRLLHSCNKTKLEEKLAILSAVYSDYSNFHVRESDILSIIEVPQENKHLIDLKGKKKKIHVIDELKIVFLDFNKVLLIKKKTHTKLFVTRIIRIIQLVFSLKVIADSASNVLDKNLLDKKGIEEKFEFFEFLLAVLDPHLYSSIDNIRILPHHYERILFKKTAEILSYYKFSANLEEKIKDKVKFWEIREQVLFLSRDNPVINCLKSKYKFEREQVTEPVLTLKAQVILNYLLDKYKDEVLERGIVGLKVDTKRPLGSVSANGIRKEINSWLIKKGFEPSLITDNELKKTPPAMLAELNKKGLVEIKEPEKGRTMYLYFVNEKDEYIQTRLRGLLLSKNSK